MIQAGFEQTGIDTNAAVALLGIFNSLCSWVKKTRILDWQGRDRGEDLRHDTDWVPADWDRHKYGGCPSR